MKRILAVTVAVAAMTLAGVAQSPKHAATTDAYVNKAEVAKAAAKVSATAAITAPDTTVVGNVAVYGDATGDLTTSNIYQSGNYVGINTATPVTTLNLVDNNPTIRVENYGDAGGASPNFNFYTAGGTATAPTVTQNGDNLGQFAATGYNGTAFGGSKVKVTFVATETWNATSNGTALAFHTTTNGTTSRLERMRIDNTGYVGIGTTTPAYPLAVNGVVQSMTGGFRFPDGTTQGTAAVSGVALSSPDNSITVTGTPTAPMVVVSPTAIQKLVGASGSAVSVPVIVAQTSFTGSYGAGTSNTIYTVAADGFYRVSVYMNVPTPGTCSSSPCAGETVTLQWNDGVSTTALATANCALTTVCAASYSTPLWVKSGQAITAYGQSYGTGSAPTGGTYNAYVLVEQLKK